jgi:chromosome partitioning protein
MAEIICIIGTKGGTGKTTLSHLLCHGLSLLGRRTACIMTDEYRDPLPPQGRRYVMADARSPVARAKVVDKLRSLAGWMGVLDGGANRTDTDISLYELSDLVLLPFRDSPEDIRTVMHDLELFPRAFALPSQWPRNKWQQEAAQKLIDSLPNDMQSRVLSPVYAIAASKLLLQNTPPDTLPTALNTATRAAAQQVLDLLGDDTASVEASLREAAA